MHFFQGGEAVGEVAHAVAYGDGVEVVIWEGEGMGVGDEGMPGEGRAGGAALFGISEHFWHEIHQVYLSERRELLGGYVGEVAGASGQVQEADGLEGFEVADGLAAPGEVLA
jgi:hypothetical protein